MKIIVDNHIPYLQSPLSTIAEVVALPAAQIDAAAVHDADALIVRTRTHCGASLLKGSSVRFIATATIGYDHIDTSWCEANGIRWTNAPGCNASSVCQYVECALQVMEKAGFIQLKGSTLGVVGLGHVGSRVKTMAESHGMKTLCCDPPLANKDSILTKTHFVSLSQIASEADIITFHVPLTYDGSYPTHHLADEAFFTSLKRKPLFINTSRGSVTDTAGLKRALRTGQIRQAVIDVWENEPSIDLDLLALAHITTPHIAGYSADGKARASQMSLDALCQFFHLPTVKAETPPVATAPYDILADSKRLKASPETFELQRSNYPIRRE